MVPAAILLFAMLWQESEPGWDPIYVWHPVSPFIKGILIILFLMLLRTLWVMGERLLRFATARRQTRRYIEQVQPAFDNRDLSGAITVARQNPKSYVATVVGAGLNAFVAARTTAVDAIAIAGESVRRTRAATFAEMKLGLGTLTTITATAPFIGLLGTIFGILNAFRGTTGSRASILAGIATEISEALVTTALSLMVAIPASWLRTYLVGKVERFDVEQANAGNELISYLRRQRATLIPVPAAMEIDAPSPSSSPWEIVYDHQRTVLVAMLAYAVYVVFMLVFAAMRE